MSPGERCRRHPGGAHNAVASGSTDDAATSPRRGSYQSAGAWRPDAFGGRDRCGGGREALLIGVATPVCGAALIVTPVGTSQPSELRSQASEIGSVGALRSFRYQLWMPTVLLPRSERPKLGLSNRHRGMSVYQIEWFQRRRRTGSTWGISDKASRAWEISQ